MVCPPFEMSTEGRTVVAVVMVRYKNVYGYYDDDGHYKMYVVHVSYVQIAAETNC